MMSDSVSVDASTIQELLQTIKTLQSDMVELKSGGNGANNPPNQTDPTGLVTLPNGVEKICRFDGRSFCEGKFAPFTEFGKIFLFCMYSTFYK